MTFPSDYAFYTDPITGARVPQITSHPSINHATYFLQRPFGSDNRTLPFISYRTGPLQLYEVVCPDGDIQQLTDGPAIHPFSPAIDPKRQHVYFVRGDSVCILKKGRAAVRVVFTLEGAQLGEVSLDATGQWLTAAYKQGVESGIIAGRTNGTSWRKIPFPRTVIHPQFHPLEPEWIEFAGDPAPRMHRVRRDGTGLECLYHHDNDEFLVHETFLGSSGDLVFTVWPRALCRMDWTTREIRTIINYNAWHIAPDRRGERVLCDTNHPDEGLQIIDMATRTRPQLCLNESSNQGTQWRLSRYALAEDFARARNELSWMETAA